MPSRRGLLFLLAPLLLLATFASAEEPLQITKTSPQAFDIPAEVIAFYKQLITDNPAVQARHQKLLDASREEASRPPQASSDIQAVAWKVAEYSRQPANSDPRSDIQSRSTYLTFQPVILGFHHGYSSPRTIVAQFNVHYQAVEKRTGTEWDSKTELLTNTLSITFAGFQKLTLSPSP